MRSALLLGALLGHLALSTAAPLQPVSGLTQWQNDILDNILTRYGITDVKQLSSLDPNAVQSINAGTYFFLPMNTTFELTYLNRGYRCWFNAICAR